jgi:cobalt-zinc-cadmium efflux system outer membrane protein
MALLAGAITLAAALAAADRSPEGQAAQARTAAAGAAESAAGAWPATSLGAATTLNTARAILTAALPLPIFGTLGAGRAVAHAEAVAASADETVTRLELRRRAERAWVELARAEARAERTEAAAQRNAELLNATRRRFDAGDAARVDVVSAEADARRARARADAEEAQIAGAAATLAGELGLDPEAPLHADGGLPDPVEPPPLETLRARLGGHPELRAATSKVDAEGARVEVAHAERWPKLALAIEGDIDDPTLPGSDLHVGLTVDVPLFGKGAEAEHAAAARQRAADVERVAVRRAIDAELVAAYRGYQAARARARALATDVVPAQAEAARLARVAYDQGQTGLVTVLTAARALIDAEIEAIDARADAALAHADLQKAAP